MPRGKTLKNVRRFMLRIPDELCKRVEKHSNTIGLESLSTGIRFFLARHMDMLDRKAAKKGGK